MTSNKKQPQPQVSIAEEAAPKEATPKKSPKIQTAEGWRRTEEAKRKAEKSKK